MRGRAVTLFSDDQHTPQGYGPDGSPVRIAPPRRVIIGWVAIAVAVLLALVLAFVPAPFVIEQPGPVFNIWPQGSCPAITPW